MVDKLQALIEKEIILYITDEIVDDVRPTDNLGNLFRKSSIGFQGAALDFIGFLERKYGITLKESREHNANNYTISEAAKLVYEQLRNRRQTV